MTRRRRASAILLVHCPDQPGLVVRVAEFLRAHGGNILGLDEHVDTRHGRFFMRVEWDLADFAIPRDEIGARFGAIAGPLDMHWTLHFSDVRPRMAVFASKLHHCLYDILSRHHSGEWKVDIPVVVSNHEETRRVADAFGVRCEVIEVTGDTKDDAEARQLALLDELDVELVILARYMQVISSGFVARYPDRIINIHHSFLPAFAGARPYHAAYERGVKVIGATSHYVTDVLDDGPIIEQDVTRVSHRDGVRDLVRRGRDLEMLVLSRAIWLHLERRTLVYENRTVVFE